MIRMPDLDICARNRPAISGMNDPEGGSHRQARLTFRYIRSLRDIVDMAGSKCLLGGDHAVRLTAEHRFGKSRQINPLRPSAEKVACLPVELSCGNGTVPSRPQADTCRGCCGYSKPAKDKCSSLHVSNPQSSMPTFAAMETRIQVNSCPLRSSIHRRSPVQAPSLSGPSRYRDHLWERNYHAVHRLP